MTFEGLFIRNSRIMRNLLYQMILLPKQLHLVKSKTQLMENLITIFCNLALLLLPLHLFKILLYIIANYYITHYIKFLFLLLTIYGFSFEMIKLSLHLFTLILAVFTLFLVLNLYLSSLYLAH